MFVRRLNCKNDESSYAIGWGIVISIIVLGLICATPAGGQVVSRDTMVGLPKFDVATIRLNNTDRGGVQILLTPDGVSLTNIPVQYMLGKTFGVQDEQILGVPDALKHARYDIQAKVADEDIPKMKTLTYVQKLAMLRPLLADRFALKFHLETREMPIYLLVVAKGRTKIKEWKRPDSLAQDVPAPHRLLRNGDTRIESQATTMSDLALQLSSILDRMVIDKTGLKENYDYSLEWAQDDSNQATDTRPSLFAALQEQLGLKLESAKGPVDVVVIDHIEPPSSN